MTRTPLLLFTAAMAAFALASCETVSDQDHRAGGGAYDDSHLARQLDSNNPALDAKDSPSAASFEQWREQE